MPSDLSLYNNPVFMFQKLDTKMFDFSLLLPPSASSLESDSRSWLWSWYCSSTSAFQVSGLRWLEWILRLLIPSDLALAFIASIIESVVGTGTKRPCRVIVLCVGTWYKVWTVQCCTNNPMLLANWNFTVFLREGLAQMCQNCIYSGNCSQRWIRWALCWGYIMRALPFVGRN